MELPVQKLIAKGFITCQASGELKVFANSEHPTLPHLHQEHESAAVSKLVSKSVNE